MTAEHKMMTHNSYSSSSWSPHSFLISLRPMLPPPPSLELLFPPPVGPQGPASGSFLRRGLRRRQHRAVLSEFFPSTHRKAESYSADEIKPLYPGEILKTSHHPTSAPVQLTFITPVPVQYNRPQPAQPEVCSRALSPASFTVINITIQAPYLFNNEV